MRRQNTPLPLRWRVRSGPGTGGPELWSGRLLAQADVGGSGTPAWWIRLYEESSPGLPVEPTERLPTMLELVTSALDTSANPSAGRWSVRVLRPPTRWRAPIVKHVERFDDARVAADRFEELARDVAAGRRPWRLLGDRTDARG